MSEENAEIEEFEIDLDTLSDEDLVEFEAALVADYDALRGSEEFSIESVDELKALASNLEVVRATMEKREELAAADDVAQAIKGASFLARIEARKAAAVAAETEEVKEVEAAAEEVEVEAKTEVKAEAKIEAPAVIINPTGLKSDVVPARGSGIVAAAGLRGLQAGTELPDFAEVAKAFVSKRPDVRSAGPGSDGDRTLVASVFGQYSEDRILDGDLDRNMAKINAVTSAEAITASGGICAPNTPYYTLTTYGGTHRPVRDAFPVYKAERGGIRFMPAPVLSDLSGSVRRTTVAQDAAGYTNQTPSGSTAPKPCLHVTCESEQTCIIQAVSRCLEFGNMGARTYPEQVEAWIKLGLVEFARYAEIELLNAVSTASTAVTAQQLYGSTYSLLDQISVVTTRFRSIHRLSADIKLRALLPFWATEIVRADIAAQAPGDGLARYNVSDAQILDWFSVRGINVTLYQDNTTAAGAPFAAQGAGVLQSWPNTIEWFVFPEGSFLYLDGGNLDLGLVRDSTLNSHNDYQIFYEEFFGLCFIGIESYKITSQVCPNGSYAVPAANLRVCSNAGS